MSHAAAAERLRISPDALEASYDGGVTWHRECRCSERNTAQAYARGLDEFVRHHTRYSRATFADGVIFRWHGEPLPLNG